MNNNPWLNKAFTDQSLKNIDNKFAPQTASQVDFLMKKMQLSTGDILLDLGCGAGRHAIEFALQGIRVTGVDISPKMLEEARKRTEIAGVNVDYRLCDLALLGSLTLDNQSFNGAVCLCESGIGVLGGENSDFSFFKMVYDLLIPGAYFVLSCFNSIRRYIRSKDTNPHFDYINSTMKWRPNIEYDGEYLSEIQRQYTPSEIKLLLQLAGYIDIQVLSCESGIFLDKPMGIEDIEMLVVAKKVD